MHRSLRMLLVLPSGRILQELDDWRAGRKQKRLLLGHTAMEKISVGEGWAERMPSTKKKDTAIAAYSLKSFPLSNSITSASLRFSFNELFFLHKAVLMWRMYLCVLANGKSCVLSVCCWHSKQCCLISLSLDFTEVLEMAREELIFHEERTWRCSFTYCILAFHPAILTPVHHEKADLHVPRIQTIWWSC